MESVALQHLPEPWQLLAVRFLLYFKQQSP